MNTLLRIIAPRCRLATCCFGAAALIAFVPAAATYPMPLAPLSDVPSAPDPTLPPSPADTMLAYQVLDAWIRGWSDPVSDRRLDNIEAGGVSIILRLSGEIVGRGSLLAPDWAGPDASSANVGDGLLRAARLAMSEAERRFKIDNDVFRDQRIRQLARDLTISLELSGSLIPFEPATFDDVERDLAPGLDGVAVRAGDQLVATFPASLLASNTSLRLACSRAASQATGDAARGLDEPARIREHFSAKYYRFRTTHLAQRTPSAAPAFLLRGSRLIDLAQINSAEIRAAADRIATHLAAREWTAQGAYGMRGLYEPWSGQYASPFASAVDQLTAVYALLRYASTPGIAPDRALAARSLSARVLRALRIVEHDESPASASPVAAALWVIIDSAITPASPAPSPPSPATVPDPADSTSAPDECRRAVLASFNSFDGFIPAVPVPARGLVALALVELAAREPAGPLRAEALGLADAAVRRAFRDASQELLIAQMPWLGFAELRLAQLKPSSPASASPEIPAAVALRQMRSDLWAHQVQPTDSAAMESLGGCPDLAGGIILSAMLAGHADAVSTSNVTWQSAQALAFIPAMLADSRLTSPDQRPLELARLLASLRFIRQLQMDDSSLWMIPTPSRALGGIKATPWDCRLSSDASSMSLLAFSETLRAMSALAPR
ncbi:MAG: hypothetical protein AB7G11_06405 [Phycisphaerales bacterium]